MSSINLKKEMVFLLKKYMDDKSKDQRDTLDVRVQQFEISPHSIRKGSKKFIKVEGTNIVTKTGLDLPEATLAAEAMCKYFRLHVDVIYDKSYESDLFELDSSGRAIGIRKGYNTIYLPISKDTCIILMGNASGKGNNFAKLQQEYITKFTKQFSIFLKKKDPLAVFLDDFYSEEGYRDITRGEFPKTTGEKSNKYNAALGQISGKSQLDLGHTGMSDSVSRTTARELKADIAIEHAFTTGGISSKTRNMLKSYVQEAFKEAHVQFATVFTKNPYGHILGTIETTVLLPHGSDANSKLGSAMEKWIFSFTPRDNKNIVKYFANAAMWEGSNSIIDNIIDALFHPFNHFSEKKRKKPKKTVTKASGKVKSKQKAPKLNFSSSSGVTSSLDISIKVKKDQERDSCGLSIQRLLQFKGLMNLNLHEQLSMNMPHGRPYGGSADEPLNYRTGRFARSATVTGLQANKDTCELNADFTYMKDPYSIFEPGGALAKPSRNPDLIIGGAIRDIAKRIMKDRFKVNTRLV